MKTRMYIDGFNLFHRLLKGQGPGHKWIDLLCLGEHIAGTPIDLVRYFSAPVRQLSTMSTEDFNTLRNNQEALFDAYKADPRVELHLGLFQLRDKTGTLINRQTRQPLGRCPSLPSRFKKCVASRGIATIQSFEEKKTDVNIASYLLKDAYENNVDKAIILSNDSDLYEPLRICRDDLGITIIAVNPLSNALKKKSRTNQLRMVATSCYELRSGTIAKYQLPSVIKTSSRTIQKPKDW